MSDANEYINNVKLRCYDNGGVSADRYSVLFMDEPYSTGQQGSFVCLGMSANPFHPQGVGMHSAAIPGFHLGKRIKFADLPEDCQNFVRRHIMETEN
jgi:hypothetical protein